MTSNEFASALKTRTPAPGPPQPCDPYTWSVDQAAALRRRSFQAVDWDNVIEVIEALSRNEASQWISHGSHAIRHMLKIEHCKLSRPCELKDGGRRFPCSVRHGGRHRRGPGPHFSAQLPAPRSLTLPRECPYQFGLVTGISFPSGDSKPHYVDSVLPPQVQRALDERTRSFRPRPLIGFSSFRASGITAFIDAICGPSQLRWPFAVPVGQGSLGITPRRDCRPSPQGPVAVSIGSSSSADQDNQSLLALQPADSSVRSSYRA